MNLFHIIEDGAVILRARGVFRQAKVFRRGRDVFAGYGGGFVKLHTGNGTSHPAVSWLELSAPGVTLGAGGQPRFEEPSDAS
jgi:hypothetical protein